MVEKQDNPIAVAIRPETDEQIMNRNELRERFWRAVERISERNADMDPEAELAFITEVVEEVRQERYEREQAEAKNGR